MGIKEIKEYEVLRSYNLFRNFYEQWRYYKVCDSGGSKETDKWGLEKSEKVFQVGK